MSTSGFLRVVPCYLLRSIVAGLDPIALFAGHVHRPVEHLLAIQPAVWWLRRGAGGGLIPAAALGTHDRLRVAGADVVRRFSPLLGLDWAQFQVEGRLVAAIVVLIAARGVVLLVEQLSLAIDLGGSTLQVLLAGVGRLGLGAGGCGALDPPRG